jgi:hypothetical protein
MIDKDMIVLQSYTNSEKVSVGPYGEQAMNIKAEEGSDAEDEAGPVPITFPEVKAGPEVSLCLYMSIVRQITQICINVGCLSDLPCLYVHMITSLCC